MSEPKDDDCEIHCPTLRQACAISIIILTTLIGMGSCQYLSDLGEAAKSRLKPDDIPTPAPKLPPK